MIGKDIPGFTKAQGVSSVGIRRFPEVVGLCRGCDCGTRGLIRAGPQDSRGRLGGAVAGAWSVEVGKDVGDLLIRVRPRTLTLVRKAWKPQRRDSMSLAMMARAAFAVGLPVGGDHALLDARGGLNIDVRVLGEQRASRSTCSPPSSGNGGRPVRGRPARPVEVTWAIYQPMIAASRDPVRAWAARQCASDRDAQPRRPQSLERSRRLGRTLKERASDVLTSFDRPGTRNGPTGGIKGRLEHLCGSALGFRNSTPCHSRKLLETKGFRPRLHPGL